MYNPFSLIDARLSNIESLLLDLKHKSAPTDTQSEVLSLKQASQMLGVKPATIYRKCSSGELPHKKRGNRLYFLREEILEYVRAGHQPTNDEIQNTNYLK